MKPRLSLTEVFERGENLVLVSAVFYQHARQRSIQFRLEISRIHVVPTLTPLSIFCLICFLLQKNWYYFHTCLGLSCHITFFFVERTCLLGTQIFAVSHEGKILWNRGRQNLHSKWANSYKLWSCTNILSHFISLSRHPYIFWCSFAFLVKPFFWVWLVGPTSSTSHPMCA